MKKTISMSVLLTATLLAAAPLAHATEPAPAAKPQPMEATIIPAVPELGIFGMMVAGCLVFAAVRHITRP